MGPTPFRIAACLSLALLGRAQTTPPVASGSISGVVRDRTSGAPVPDITLVLTGASPMQRQRSNEHGDFTFSVLKPGLYQLSAHGTSSVLGTKSIVLDADRSLDKIDLAIAIPGSLSGRVLDEDRKPMIGIRVLLMSRVYVAGTLDYSSAGVATSNEKGVYQFEGVQPGTAYQIVAVPRPQRSDPISKEPEDPAEREPLAAETWFPGAGRPESGATVTLFSGERRENLDLRVLHRPARCVEAVLESPAGPAALEFRLADSAGLLLSASKTAADGRVRLCQSERDALELVAFREPAAGVPALLGKAGIPPADRDVTKLRIVTQPAGTVAGLVVWDGDPAPAQEVKLSVRLSNRQPLPFDSAVTAAVSAPGSFSLQPLGEEQSVAVAFVGEHKGIYVKEMTYGGVPLRNNRFHLGAAAGNPELRIVLARDGGTLTTVVRDSDGKPVPGVWVVVTPAGAASEGEMSTRMWAGVTDRSGAFSDGLRPGKYLALATTTALDLNSDTIAALWRRRGQAAAVEVGPGATALVTVTITKSE